jgi:hypothetical protein
MDLKKLRRRIKCKKFKPFKQETELKNKYLQVDLVSLLETNVNTQQKQKSLNILLERNCLQI